MKLIDKDLLKEELNTRIEVLSIPEFSNNPLMVGERSAYLSILSFLDTIEVKEVNLDESARHYLLHEHISPLNEVLHQADLRVEMQYHTDIEDAYKAGFELGIKTKGE